MKKFGRLRRLDNGFYQGLAMVHWSMTVDRRRTGWIDDATHLKFREAQLHTLGRYGLLCPAYCLMPDHLHVIWIGTRPDSDQLRAAAFFRRYFNDVLKSDGFSLQEQSYDHVLQDEEREKGAFESLVYYIAENPVRAGLAEASADWAYSGSLAVGYPHFDWRDRKFREKVWTVYSRECERGRENR